MSISNEAVNAAAYAAERVHENWGGWEAVAHAALEAAAPHMFAAALQLADKWQPDFPYKAQELREALGVKHD